MTTQEYLEAKAEIILAGYRKEIEWAENLKPCESAFAFFVEYGWVVVNSGMKNQVAVKIWGRILDAFSKSRPISEVFGHKGKVAAIEYVWRNQHNLFIDWGQAQDKLAFLKSLPWIGDITKYHLAKNLGTDIAKPDRHLVRIAERSGETVQGLCERLSNETGDRVALVDLVIWRACNLGIITSMPSSPPGE